MWKIKFGITEVEEEKIAQLRVKIVYARRNGNPHHASKNSLEKFHAKDGETAEDTRIAFK